MPLIAGIASRRLLSREEDWYTWVEREQSKCSVSNSSMDSFQTASCGSLSDGNTRWGESTDGESENQRALRDESVVKIDWADRSVRSRPRATGREEIGS